MRKNSMKVRLTDSEVVMTQKLRSREGINVSQGFRIWLHKEYKKLWKDGGVEQPPVDAGENPFRE